MRLAVAVLWAALTACAAPQTGAEGEASGAARSVGTSGANVEITEKGGGGADQARSLRARARSLTDEASCEAAGGVWGRGGLSPQPFCNMRYPDAGAACSDASECGGRCLAAERAGDEKDEGEDLLGRCQTFTSEFGCYALIEGGQVGPTLCVD